jgi:hypothetical protein
MDYNVKHTMQSFLLLGSDQKNTKKKADTICKQQGIHIFDQVHLKKEKSIGIEDVRNLQKEILLMPLKSAYKAAILYDADSMTADAQNAFLKTLEEPPRNTIIIMLGENKEHFLPTVLSRCTVIYIASPDEKIDSQNTDLVPFSPHDLPTSLTEKLQHAETLAKTKDMALAWVTTTIVSLRHEMINTPHPSHVFLIRKLQTTYRLLKNTNANTRVILEHLFLSIN